MITQFDALASLSNTLLPLLFKGDYSSFPKFIESVSTVGENAIRDAIQKYIETLDLNFRNSIERLKLYHVKDNRFRTITTMFGTITYKRTIYINKYTNKRFCYVDEKLGIDKYIRYTNDVGSYAYEAYGDENSMIKIGKELGNLIFRKFSLSKNEDYIIPRQTIYNLLKRVKEVRVLPKDKLKEIDDIYLLFDEKYISLNGKDSSDKENKEIMIKSCLICEGLDTSKKRHKYINPHYLSIYGDDLCNKLEDYLNNTYDTEKIKRIHFLSDGGTWINAIYKDLLYPRNKKIKYLDKFHGFKSLWNISLDNDLYSSLIKSLYNDSKEELFKIIDGLKETNPNRSQTIEKEEKYLKNHYLELKRILKLKSMNCSMEQVISHHITSQFANVPKAYSKENINRYLAMRDNYRNNENLKELYLYALNHKDEEEVIVNSWHVDQSTFNGNRIYNNPTALNRSGIIGDEDPGLDSGQDDYN